MSTGMLSIGITGITAAQQGLQVTQHNIANANTTGYNRQYIQQSAAYRCRPVPAISAAVRTVDSVASRLRPVPDPADLCGPESGLGVDHPLRPS
jgi:flagellar basal body rod protein FlgC